MARAAKKRKRDDDEEFRLPEFDEAGYMRKEVEGARVAIVLILLAIPVAALLWALTVGGAPIVAFFLGLGITFLLPRILAVLPWPKVDISKFERRDWLGHGATFLFSWLAIWILLLNAPFADLTPPVFAQVTVNGVVMEPGVQNDAGAAGTVTLNATIFENVGLSSVAFVVDGATQTPTRLDAARFTLQVILPAGAHQVTMTARDVNGLEATFAFGFALSP